jgi:ankyrin repeat protein
LLEEDAELFMADACLRYDGDDRAFRPQRAAAMLQQQPRLAFFSLYSALAAGNLAAVREKLNQDAALINVSGGPLCRPPMLYLTYSRVPADKAQVLGCLRLLLEQGADADAHVMLGGVYRFSALTGAMGEGERGPIACAPHPYADELVAMLLAAGASPNEAQGLYNTMFTGGIDKWLPLLIAHGLNKDHQAWTMDNPQTTFDYFLAQAVPEGRIGRVKLLIEHGADPNSLNTYNKKSCYTNAMVAGHGELAAYLLEQGARAEPLSANDEFRAALRRGDETRMTALLEQHPDLCKEAVLLREASHFGIERVRWLLSHGFDINGQTPDGRTLLMDRAHSDDLDAVKRLLELGADPAISEPTYGATALGFALHNRRWNVVNYLAAISDNLLDLSRIPDVERATALLSRDPSLVLLKTPMGNTALHVVSQAKDQNVDVEASAAMIDLLLANGADIEARNNEGLTPLQWYRKLGIDAMVELLQQRGARAER